MKTRFMLAALALCVVRGAEEARADERVPIVDACTAPNKKSDPSCEHSWALRHVGAIEAHRRLRAEYQGREPGHGVVVAHIDTGIAEPPPRREMHPSLNDKAILTTDAEGNRLPLFFYGDCDARANCAPRDQRAGKEPADMLVRTPLPFATQPGHGTGTSSILIARGTLGPDGECDEVCGIAPGVRLIPYLVTGGVILSHGRALQVGNAIKSVADENRLTPSDERPRERRRVDVITLSMGIRSPDPELEAAVRYAESQGVIVIAAAGQGPLEPSHVRFPAQYPSVIAVSGTNVEATPWRLGHPRSYPPSAGRGPEVTISAPAADVWRADWNNEGGREVANIGRGRGTSFAAPLVAGTAALWIQHFTRAGLDKRYGRAAVPAAFRYWLTQHGYRTPPEMCDLVKGLGKAGVCANQNYRWDIENKWGKGIVAADRLLGPEGLDGPDETTRLEVLPTAREVCQDVYRRRGQVDLGMVCPPGSPGRDETVLTESPPKQDQEKRTYTSGIALLGRPFGQGPIWHPAISYGIIFSDHDLREPKGFMVQGTAAVRSFKGMIGFAQGFQYSPFGHSRRYEVGMIPGFGPTVGYAIKAGYMRAVSNDFLGGQLEIVVYRYKFEIGPFWRIGSNTDPDVKHRYWTWSFGFGF
jgi:hypothetical protein